MKSNKYLFIFSIFSIAYVAANIFLEKQLDPILADWKTVLFWITIGLSIINISLLLIHLFLRAGAVSAGAILLCIAQISVFFQLHLQIYAKDASHYLCASSPPPLSDWLAFIVGHLIKAMDIVDATEAYNLLPLLESFGVPQNIRHQSMISSIPLVAMYLVIALLIVGFIFNIIKKANAEKSKESQGIKKWILPGLLGTSLVVLIGLSFTESGGNNWYMIPVNAVLLTLDIGDAFQIFNALPSPLLPTIEPGLTGMSIALASATVFFRLIFGIFLIVLFQGFLSRFSKGGAKSIDELGKLFASPDQPLEDRMAALKEIENFGSFADGAIPYLVKVLADTNADIRTEAGRVLTELDSEWHQNEAALNAISELSKGLASKESEAKIAAANALGEFGPGAREVISRLVSLLTYHDPEVQIACAEALGKIGTEAEEAVPELVNMLLSKDETVQLTAAEALGNIGQAAAIPHLIRLLSKDDKSIRETAMETLEKIDPQWHQSELASEAITEFVRMLKEELGPTRITAIEMLGVMGGNAAQAIPDLVPVLIDSDEAIRRAAGEALDQIDPEWQQSESARQAIPDFVKALIESEKEVRQAAGEALGKIDPEWRKSGEARKALSHFVKTLSHNLNTLRMAAAEALGDFGPAAIKTVPYLVKILSDKDSDVRSTTAKALGRIDPKWQQSESTRKALPALVKALSDDDGKTRSASAGAIGAIGAGAVSAIPYLVKCLIDSDRDVRNEVKTALTKIDPKWRESKGARSMISHFVKVLGDKQWSVRLAAVEALGEFGPVAGKTAPYLFKATKDSVVDVRNIAAEALEKVDPAGKFREQELPTFQRARTAADIALETIDMSSPDAIPQLVNMMADSDREIRNAAKKALEKKDPQWQQSEGAKKAIPQLSDAMADSRWIVRSAAAEALGEFGALAAGVIPRLVKAMNIDSSMDVKSSAKKALQKIDPSGKSWK